MFEFLSLCLLFLLAIGAIVLLAFPHAFSPESESTKITVGGSYWGSYKHAKESPDKTVIEINRKYSHTKSLAGSNSYASGKGTG